MAFDHFIIAQDSVYANVVRELSAGQKRSHWMWFIFPQLRGLGSSAMADKFALDSVDEARRYLQHPLLGARLRECTQLVLDVPHRTAEDVFGFPDYLKFHSSMTLFALCSPVGDLFDRAILKYFAAEKDPKTLDLLGLRDDSPA